MAEELGDKLAELYPRHVAGLCALMDELLAESGHQAAVFHSGSVRYAFLDDYAIPFRANPLFKAWVPLGDVPDCFLVYRPGRRPGLVLTSPEDFWHAPPQPPEAWWADQLEVRVVPDAERALAALEGLDVLGEATAVLGEHSDAIAGLAGERNPAGLIASMHYARGNKSPYELECMREANRIAVRGHRAAEAAFRDGASEHEIHLAYMGAAGQGEELLPYGSIVALDEHGAILHYQHRETVAPEGRSFLIDAGASFLGYAADITRTYSRDPGDEFAALIELMDAAQCSICDQLRPGLDYRDLHIETHRRIARVMEDAGLIRCEAEVAVEEGLTRAFFPHGLGHLIGLQVHDVGGLAAGPEGGEIPRPEGHPFLRLTRELEPDMVLTIEPGLYFIPSLLEELGGEPQRQHVDWDRVEQLRRFGGIRIEDDVRVTEDGHENLSRDAFGV